MGVHSSLYDQVVKVTYPYLGVAADRFCKRQVAGHLKKDPDELKKRDLQKLIAWFSLAMAALSEDPAVVKQYEADLQQLIQGQSQEHDLHHATN